MALVDNNQIFNEFAYLAKTQVETQKTNLFNAESNGALVMLPMPFTGDYYNEASFKRMANLLEIRDAYADAATTTDELTQLKQQSVKVAAATPAVQMDKMWYDWIQQSPELAAAAYGQQLAVTSVRLKLNTIIQALVTVIGKESDAVLDRKGTTAKDTDQLDLNMILDGQQLFGDASGDLSIVVCHSKAWTAYLKRNVAQFDQLFTYGSLVVRRDVAGRLFVVTDSPSLTFTDNAITKYRSLILAPMAGVIMEDPTLYRTNIIDTNDKTFIKTTIKSQLGWGIHIKNHSWTGSERSPTKTELEEAGNWAKVDTNVEVKEFPGVIIEHQA